MKISFRHKLIFALSVLIAHNTHADRLSGVDSFVYQLQGSSIAPLSQTPVDLAVIDYSRDGSKSGEFSGSEISSIKRSGKIVLSYLSVGEAEDYRWYFKQEWVKKTLGGCKQDLSIAAPPWMVKLNPDWCGNYKIKYWDKAWRKILFGTTSGSKKSYLDRIIDAGFSGVYLDIIDGFEFFQSSNDRTTKRLAANRMAELVIDIAYYARRTRGDNNFVVVVQNGTGIFSKLSGQTKLDYLDAIDGIGAEDTFYYGPNDENNPLQVQKEVVKTLSWLVTQGKKVFAIDYVSTPSKVNKFKSLACSKSFIPQVADRSLAKLRRQTIRGC
jgi:cysteinyl-tRNA synthetase